MIFAKGDHVRALEVYREALAALELVGDRPEIARVHCEMGGPRSPPGTGRSRMRAFRLGGAGRTRRSAARAAPGSRSWDSRRSRRRRGGRRAPWQIAAAAKTLSARAGLVIDHTMDPGVVAADRGRSRRRFPAGTLDGLVASASTLTPAAVLAMVSPVAGGEPSGLPL